MIFLQRPICFFDLETTGTNFENDRIIEVCFIKLMPSGDIEKKVYRLNPQIPIPTEATAVHGISEADVATAPIFPQVADDLYKFIRNCDLGGFNCTRFDIPLLCEEFSRCNIKMNTDDIKIIDVMTIYHKNETRKLEDAVKLYTGKSQVNSHGAEADTCATIDVFKAQIENYPDLPKTIEELHNYCFQGKNLVDFSGKFTKDENGLIRFNFGPHYGEPVSEHIGFLRWMLKKSFSNNTKNAIDGIFKGIQESKVKPCVTADTFPSQKFGNWLVTYHGIKWVGAATNKYFIPKERLHESGSFERELMYDWLVHMPSKGYVTEADTYSLNTAFVYATELYGLDFNNRSFMDTLVEQKKVLEKKPIMAQV